MLDIDSNIFNVDLENYKEMNEVAIYSPLISKFIIKKTSHFYKIIS